MCYLSDAGNVSNNNESLFRNRVFSVIMTIALIRVIPVICAISVMWAMSVAKVNLAMRENEINFSYKSSNKKKKRKTHL